MSPRQLVGLLAALLLFLGSAACGNTGSAAGEEPTGATTGSATPTPSATPEPAPKCSDVWVSGGTLPAGYESCVDDAGAEVQDEVIECSSGQNIVVHGNTHYAAPGGKIAQARNVNANPRFKKILQVCKG